MYLPILGVIILAIEATATNAQTIRPEDVADSCSSGYKIDQVFVSPVKIFEQCHSQWFHQWQGYWYYNADRDTSESYYEVYVGDAYQGRFQGDQKIVSFGTIDGSWGQSIRFDCNSSTCKGTLYFAQTNCNATKCYMNPAFHGKVVQRQCDVTVQDNDSIGSLGVCEYCPPGKEPSKNEHNSNAPCIPCKEGYVRGPYNDNGGYCRPCDKFRWQSHTESQSCHECVREHTIPGPSGVPQTNCNCKSGFQGLDCGFTAPSTNSDVQSDITRVPTPTPDPSSDVSITSINPAPSTVFLSPQPSVLASDSPPADSRPDSSNHSDKANNYAKAGRKVGPSIGIFVLVGTLVVIVVLKRTRRNLEDQKRYRPLTTARMSGDACIHIPESPLANPSMNDKVEQDDEEVSSTIFCVDTSDSCPPSPHSPVRVIMDAEVQSTLSP